MFLESQDWKQVGERKIGVIQNIKTQRHRYCRKQFKTTLKFFKMDVILKHQNTKYQPQNSLLGDKILHRCSTVFSLDLAEVKNTIDIEGWKLHKNSGQEKIFV